MIDPTKVTRTALQNAASVATLLLTSDALIAEKPKKEAKRPAAAATAATTICIEIGGHLFNQPLKIYHFVGPLEGGQAGFGREESPRFFWVRGPFFFPFRVFFFLFSSLGCASCRLAGCRLLLPRPAQIVRCCDEKLQS